LRLLIATGALAFLLAGTSSYASAHAGRTTDTAVVVVAPDVANWTSSAVPTSLLPHPGHALRNFAARVLARTSTIANGLTRSALHYIGTPYSFGGTSAGGFDCSGFVQHVFALKGIALPRTADAQYYEGRRILGGLHAGDLVFFQTYEPGPSHVGIYIGANKFVHASSSHGVMISSLSDSYWGPKFIGAKRYVATAVR